MRVAILGASDQPDRYAHKAFVMLREYKHTVFPVAPGLGEVEGVKAYARLAEVPQPIDTLTVYLRAEISSALEQEILAAKAKRVIFPPGAENPDLESKLKAAGAEVLEACTMVMLRTNQF